jgi:hypothetical protein
MSRVKGSNLINRMKYIDAKATPEQKEKILALLDPELRKLIQHGVLPSTWYPFDYINDLLEKTDRVMGQGDLALVPQIGRFVGEQAVHGIYKIFIKFGSVGFIIEKAAALWGQLNDSGQMKGVQDTPKSGRILLTNFPTPSKALGYFLQGWSEAVVELSGEKNVKASVTHWPDAQNSLLEITACWD